VRALLAKDSFFDKKWAYWPRDTIPGTRRVIEVPGGRLFFPEEEPELVAKALRLHWAEAESSHAASVVAG